MRPWAVIALALSMVSAFGAGAAAATPAGGSLTINVLVGSCAVTGSVIDGTPVTVKLKNAQGQVRASIVVASDPGTGYFGCFPGATSRPGDRITAKQSGVTASFTVPDVDITLNRATDLIKGKAPDGWHLTVEVNRCLGACELLDEVVIPSASTTWQIDHIGIIGDDRVDVLLMAPDFDQALYRFRVPYLSATIGSARLVGAGKAGTAVTATLRKDGADVGAVTRTPGFQMAWEGDLRINGAKVKVKGTQQLRSSQGAAFNLEVRAGLLVLPLLHRITGICMEEAAMWLLRVDPPTGPTVTRSGDFGNEPTFSTNEFDPDDLDGYRLTLTCVTADGDRVRSIRDL